MFTLPDAATLVAALLIVGGLSACGKHPDKHARVVHADTESNLGKLGIQANYRQAIMQGLHLAADQPGGTGAVSAEHATGVVVTDVPNPLAATGRDRRPAARH